MEEGGGGGKMGGCMAFSLPYYSNRSTRLCMFKVQIHDNINFGYLKVGWSLSYILNSDHISIGKVFLKYICMTENKFKCSFIVPLILGCSEKLKINLNVLLLYP